MEFNQSLPNESLGGMAFELDGNFSLLDTLDNVSTVILNTSNFTTPRVDVSKDLRIVIARNIRKLAVPILMVISFIGNMLSLCVFSRKTFRHTSCGVYFMNLAVFDFLSISFHLIVNYIGNDYPLVSNNEVMCVILRMCYQNTRRISNWTLVALTVDRFIAIGFPIHTARLCSPRRAVVTIVAIIISFTIFGLDNVWFVSVNNGLCVSFNLQYANIIDKYVYFESFLATFPGVIILVLNVAIIYTLRHRVIEGTGSLRVSSAARVERKMTKMLLSVSFFFLITYLPIVVLRTMATVGTVCTFPIGRKPNCYLTMVILATVMMMNYSFNFFLYCIRGSKFRKELRRLLCCCPRRAQPLQKTEASATTSNSSSHATLSPSVSSLSTNL